MVAGNGTGLWWILIWILITLFGFGNYTLNENYETVDYYENGIVEEVYEPEKPAMISASLNGSNLEDYYISNTYDIDVLSRDVVGQVGVPICVSAFNNSSDVDAIINDGLTLTFYYDESKLEGDEENLGILWYNETDYWYEQITDCEYDYENNCITVDVNAMGTYILEDLEIWVAVWNGTYEYEDEMLDPEAHWHNEFYYKDIEELADTSIYDESGEYHIYTVNQLAGLVKLVNEGNHYKDCCFYLEADLDLAGYRWVPIGWYYPADNGYMWEDYPFQGKFYGNGHTIYNMYISEEEQSNLGMFGRALEGFEVKDLALVDCHIEGKYYVGGIVGDVISHSGEYDIENCFVVGYVSGQLDVGAIVGSAASLEIKDCYAWLREGSTEVIAADMRGESDEVNCHINDDEAREKLAQYIE
ncbi:MAG: hypothetical protein J6A59_03485 [Lachnospiraceae bacterium]|nr:hypothetical protein [Lachnospiraceae bacterium]